MKKYQNKYRIPSARARFWDYGRNAAYFVTICTQNRVCWLGDVADDEMVLSDIGIIADQCWAAIPDHFPFVKLGVHVVMPNHVHGIIIIDKPSVVETQNIASQENTIGVENAIETQNIASQENTIGVENTVETQNIASQENTTGVENTVETQNIASLRTTQSSIPKNKFGPQSQNLASIIRGFKIGVTKNARLINADFAWQPRYHDRIIRDKKEYQRISQYIINNPANWGKDKFHLR